jgi:hypothetical protein
MAVSCKLAMFHLHNSLWNKWVSISTLTVTIALLTVVGVFVI